MSESKRYYWLDIIKIIACLSVIINHTCGYLLEYTNNAHYATIFYSIQFALCKIGVPLFLMVSGYLLLNRNENISFKEVFKRIYRIIVPLIFISLLLYIKEIGIKNFNFLDFIINFLKKPYIIPFWYLYMLIGLYVAMPFLKKMINNFKIKDYRIFIILFLLLPSLLIMVSDYLNIPISTHFTKAIFPIHMTFFISGMYLSKVNLNKKYLIISLFIFISSAVLFFLSLYLPFINNNSISYKLNSLNIILVLESLSIFYIIRYLFENATFNKWISKIICEVSKVTFGIYLIHYLIAYQFYNFVLIQNIFALNPILGILSLELGLFLGCGLLIFIFRKIPIIKKFC